MPAPWVGFAPGFYWCPFKHISVVYSGFGGDIFHLAVWGWWQDFATWGLFVGAAVEISVGVV